MKPDDISIWLARGIYLFGLALILTAAIDLFTTVWPLRPTDIAWRYGFLGLTAGYLQTPTLGLLVIALTAAWQRRPLILHTVGSVSLALALILLLAMGMFALDVLQIRELRAAEGQATVLAGGLFQEVKYFVAFLVLTFMGYGSVKTASELSQLLELTRERDGPGIVAAPAKPPE
jgi:hypothetical protein